MNDWERVLLLGTDHHILPSEIRKYYADMGLDATLSDPAFMRISLAMHVGLKKISTPVFISDKPELSQNISESKKDDTDFSNELIIPVQQLNFLKSVCKNDYFIEIHLSIFDQFRKKNHFIPMLFLPPLFDISCNDSLYFRKLKPVISENGFRLLQKNTNWKSLIPLKDEKIWFLGTFKERYSLLSHLCAEFPDLAMKLLSNTWKEERFYDKIQFLLLFEKNDILPSSDLLNLIRDDNNPELLIITTRIRYRLIPDDPTLMQLKEELLASISTSEETLWIKIPEEWPETWTMCGIHPEGKKPFSFSKKMNAFVKAVSLIEPNLWNEKLNLTPEKFLQALKKESLYHLFLPPIIQAILHFKHEEWAIIILHQWIGNQERSNLADEVLPSLLEILSFEGSIKLTKTLLHSIEPLEKESILLKILLNPYMAWSEKNTQHLQFHLIKIWEKYLSRGFFAFEYYQSLFLVYAKRCPLGDILKEESWLETLEIPSNQPSLFEAYMEILNIRRQINNLL